MNKQELIDAVAEKTGASKKQTADILSGLIDVVSGSLAKGEDVQLVGFGTFSVSSRAARTGRNPKTGEEIKIAAAKVPKFSAGKSLKEACK